jgi:hypothetical protein
MFIDHEMLLGMNGRFAPKADIRDVRAKPLYP